MHICRETFARIPPMFVIVLACFAVCDVVRSAFSDIDLNGFATGPVGYKMIGPIASASFGHRAHQAGDFNGDGYADIIIGVEGQYMAYVVFGRLGNVAATVDMAGFTSSATTGIRLIGATAGDLFGCTTGGAGDVNGDEYDDVMVGAVFVTYSGRSTAGAAYVIFGHPNAQVQ